MLKSYLYRLYDTIVSRGDLEVELLVFDDQSSQRGFIEGRLKFYDGSRQTCPLIPIINISVATLNLPNPPT